MKVKLSTLTHFLGINYCISADNRGAEGTDLLDKSVLMTWLPLLTPNLLETVRHIQQKHPNSKHNHTVGHTKLAYDLPAFHLPILNSYFYHHRFLADVARFAVTLAP